MNIEDWESHFKEQRKEIYLKEDVPLITLITTVVVILALIVLNVLLNVKLNFYFYIGVAIIIPIIYLIYFQSLGSNISNFKKNKKHIEGMLSEYPLNIVNGYLSHSSYLFIYKMKGHEKTYNFFIEEMPVIRIGLPIEKIKDINIEKDRITIGDNSYSIPPNIQEFLLNGFFTYLRIDNKKLKWKSLNYHHEYHKGHVYASSDLIFGGKTLLNFKKYLKKNNELKNLFKSALVFVHSDLSEEDFYYTRPTNKTIVNTVTCLLEILEKQGLLKTSTSNE